MSKSDATPSAALPLHSSMSTVARNSAFVLGMQIVLKILAFAFNVYIVRRLGDVHFGRYSAVTAYVAVFAIFTDWGLSPYSMREMARDEEATSWLLPNVISLRILFSLVILLVAPLSAMWLGKSSEMTLGILIASAGLILYAFHGPLHSALVSRERLDYTSTFSLVNSLIFWGVGALLLMSGMGFIGLVIASLVGVFVMATLSGWALWGLGVRDLEISVRRWPELFLGALPFGVSGIASVLRQRFDTVLMSFVLTDAEVGWYNVPWTLINMTLLLAQSLAVSLYPSMVRSYNEEPSSLRRFVWRYMKYLLILCLPISVGGTLLAERIIITLYEETFIRSVPVLRIMLWALPSLFLLELLGRVSSTLQLERRRARIDVISAGVTVGLNLLLIPTLGIVGAALALLGGWTVRLIQYWVLIGSDRLTNHRWDAMARVGVAAAAMGAVVFVLQGMGAFGPIDSKLGLVALIGIGAGVYAALLLILGVIDQKEIAFLRTLTVDRFARRKVG